MMKTIKNKLVTAGLLTGLTFGGSGCATMNEADLLGIALGLGSVNKNNNLDRNQRRALGFLGNAAREQGNRQHEREVAEIGKTRIHIDNYGNRTEKSVGRAFGDIQKVWVDHNVYGNKGRERGIKIHTKFRIANNKGWPTQIGAYFNHRNGSKLEDDDGLYNTTDGQVCVGSKKLIPSYVDTTYHDVTMFMPSDQFDINKKGRHNLKFNVILWDYSEGTPKQLDKSNWKYINYNKK